MWRRATVCLDRDLDRTIHLLEACLDASWRIYAWPWVKPGHLLRVLPGAGPNPGVEEIAVEVVAADANRTELQVTSYSRVLSTSAPTAGESNGSCATWKGQKRAWCSVQ